MNLKLNRDLRTSSRFTKAARALTLIAATVAGTLVAFSGPAHAATPPVAQTPPMGYNTWYEYHGAGNEATVLAQGHGLISTGLAKSGYLYVNLDDGWLASARTSTGALTWNRTLFPHGMPWLAAQLHSMGLKFGMYEAIGSRTCQGFPGSWGHYTQDAKSFASWGADFVKIDECGGLPTGTTPAKLTQAFQQYGAALRAANPNVVYSEELPIYTMPSEPGGLSTNFLNAIKSSSQFANMWRVAADERTSDSATYTILGHLDADLPLNNFAGPGHWNDLDMLIPGVPKFGWKFTDEQSQIGVWAEEGSPLIVSTNIATLTPAELAALKNPVMINIDRSGQAPNEFMSGKAQVVFKNYIGGGKAVLLANRGTGTTSGTIPVSKFGIKGAAKVYNVWGNKTQTTSQVGYTLAPGQTALLVVG
jgi:alpha-galactosidase